MNDDGPEKLFQELCGEQLSAVTFVQDYLQLSFDGPGINVMNPLTVESEEKSITSWNPGFRDFLCDQIAKIVADIEYKDRESLRIHFKDGAVISISLHDEDYTCGEAIYAHGFKDHAWFAT